MKANISFKDLYDVIEGMDLPIWKAITCKEVKSILDKHIKTDEQFEKVCSYVYDYVMSNEYTYPTEVCHALDKDLNKGRIKLSDIWNKSTIVDDYVDEYIDEPAW